ncbi:MAG TPA: hypothetical protein PLK41_08080 [Defluviitoga tunisiensis]|nr:hypothetical protein [Defluviitoga tunisiensis]
MYIVLFGGIKKSLSKNRDFDFAKSIIESIEKYFRRSGAIQKPYFAICKIKFNTKKLFWGDFSLK